MGEVCFLLLRAVHVSMEECVLRVDESMLEQVHCILYDNDEAPRIYWKDFILQNEIDSSDDSEW